jgi:phytoene desaturase
MKAIIVGGGLGGMISALLLARAGAQITLLERKEELGGRLAYEQNERYRIDRGPTIVLLPDMLRSIMREAGIADDEYELVRCDPMYRLHYPDGFMLTKWSDTERMAQELERISSADSAGYRRYMADMEPLFRAARQAFLERPFLRKRAFFTASNVKLLAKLRVHLNVRQLAGRYFADRRVIDAFSLQTLYVGGKPSGSPSLYTFIPYAEHAFGIWYVKGGYASLAAVLQRALRRAGVAVRTGAEGAVRQITTHNGAVTGLVLEDGTRHTGETIIYNGDFPHLSAMLQGCKMVVDKRTYKPSTGCVLVYVGASRTWEDDGRRAAHQFMMPEHLAESLNEIEASRKFPDDGESLPAYYIFNPCLLDETAAPTGETVLYFLIPAPIPVEPHVGYDWDAHTGSLIERVLADADARLFPGLLESMLWRKVRTPKAGADEGWYKGGSFGIAPTVAQSGAFRPQFAPYKIKGLYSVGASIHPGGGVPIVMQGAKMLADHLIEEWAAWTTT